ncbi:MAG: DNA polymerase [Gammaproteobacteria bacterium]
MSNIRQCFVSRRGDAGRLVEADLSQIEIVCLAELSDDPQLKTDIRLGVDFHTLMLSQQLGIPYETAMEKLKAQEPGIVKQRHDVKCVRFKKNYGGGVRGVAKGLGLREEVVKELYRLEDERYPGVPRMHAAWLDTVERSKTPSESRTTLGYPACVGFLTCPFTRKRYTFLEEDAPSFTGKEVSFRPTQIKNYAVQGLAAELVKLAIGDIARKHPRVLMINTIHDSIVVDVRVEYVHAVVDILRNVLEDLPASMEATYGVTWDTPIRCDISTGVHWGAMEKLK